MKKQAKNGKGVVKSKEIDQSSLSANKKLT